MAGQLFASQWRCRDRGLILGPVTRVMGVLNVTPDSFSDGGHYFDPAKAIARGFQMVEEGADILDIGGQSTRPGAEPLSPSEELDRILPALRALSGKTKALISVDTVSAEVARAALDLGAHILNDVSAMTFDPAMASLAAETGAGVILMHMRGTPRTMQQNPTYENVVGEVANFLAGRVEALSAMGVERGAVLVDPGICFGKTVDHNVQLLRGIPRIAERCGRPVAIGLSRKSFLGHLTGCPIGERLAPSLAGLSYAVLNGARVVRVHDVKESCAAVRLLDTLKQEQAE